MYGVLAIGAAIALAAALIGWQRYDRRRIDAQFRSLAKETGLRLTIPKSSVLGLFRGFPRLDGKIEGLDVSVECHVAGHEELNRSELLLRVSVPSPRKFGMIICRKRQLGVRRTADSLTPWTSGDSALDDVFSFWTSDADAMAEFLDAGLRETLSDRWPRVRVCCGLNQGALTFHVQGLLRTPEKLADVQLCLAAAIAMAKRFQTPVRAEPEQAV